MKSKLTKKFSWVFLLPALLMVPASAAIADGASQSVVRHVTDGDTLVLQNGEKVRLIGVDTPEIHDDAHRNYTHAQKYGQAPRIVDAYALKAREFSQNAVEGQAVRLEYDWQRQDKFGRTLAYVYRVPDNFFLNAELIKQGYGFAYTRFPFKYKNEFSAYQADARKGHTGLWGKG